jgi:photosystem II stability/assembly factor-like uncharacterized protein
VKPRTAFFAIACPTATSCWAISDEGLAIVATSNGGASWSAEHVPSGIGYLGGIACPTATSCLIAASRSPVDGAPDEAVLVTTNSGRSWHEVSVPKVDDGMGDDASIACPSSRVCVVAGYGVLTTHDGGSTWTSRAVPRGTLPFVAVTCRGTLCVALGYSESAIPSYASADIAVSDDAGSTWALVDREVRSVSDLDAAACRSAIVCLAVGEGYTVTKPGSPPASTQWPAIVSSSDAARSWKTARGPKPVTYLSGIACPTPTRCIAVGTKDGATDGAILVSANGGGSWTEAALP